MHQVQPLQAAHTINTAPLTLMMNRWLFKMCALVQGTLQQPVSASPLAPTKTHVPGCSYCIRTALSTCSGHGQEINPNVSE